MTPTLFKDQLWLLCFHITYYVPGTLVFPPILARTCEERIVDLGPEAHRWRDLPEATQHTQEVAEPGLGSGPPSSSGPHTPAGCPPGQVSAGLRA